MGSADPGHRGVLLGCRTPSGGHSSCNYKANAIISGVKRGSPGADGDGIGYQIPLDPEWPNRISNLIRLPGRPDHLVLLWDALHQQSSPTEMQGAQNRGDIDQHVFDLGQQPLAGKKS